MIASTSNGIKHGPTLQRSTLDSAQYDAYDHGFYGESVKYQKDSRNYRAYLLGQQDRDLVEIYADECLKDWD